MHEQIALFLHTGNLFSSGRRSFFALSAAGHMFGPRPGFVARALGVQSRAELALLAGSICGKPEGNRPRGNPRTVICYIFHSAAVCQCLLQVPTPAL